MQNKNLPILLILGILILIGILVVLPGKKADKEAAYEQIDVPVVQETSDLDVVVSALDTQDLDELDRELEKLESESSDF